MSVVLKVLRNFFETILAQWPNLVGTFCGVLLGGLATLAIVRWQVRDQKQSRRQLSEHEDHDGDYRAAQ